MVVLASEFWDHFSRGFNILKKWKMCNLPSVMHGSQFSEFAIPTRDKAQSLATAARTSSYRLAQRFREGRGIIFPNFCVPISELWVLIRFAMENARLVINIETRLGKCQRFDSNTIKQMKLARR